MVDRILQLAKEKGVRQSYVEDKIGGYRGKLTEWKRGKALPKDDEIKMLAIVLDTTEAYLRGETDNPSPQDGNSPLDDETIKLKRDIAKIEAIWPFLSEDARIEVLNYAKFKKYEFASKNAGKQG